MSTQAERRRWRAAAEAALNERDRAEAYRLRQVEIRRGNGGASNRPRPQEFDEGGFPIPQPMGGFLSRVRRLVYDR